MTLASLLYIASRKVQDMFWRLVPHRHVWEGFHTKYGATIFCRKCGKMKTIMTGYPWGD
jgi:hypothetical protein